MLYTFLMEYRGGTYVSQVRSTSIEAACKKWIKKLDRSSIKYFTEKARRTLYNGIAETDNKPVKLKGLAGIYFSDVILGKHIAFIHIIRTLE